MICNFSMEKIPFKLMIFVVNLPLLGCIWFARNVPCDTFQVTLEVFYSNLALPFGTRESPGVLQFQQCWYESSIFWDARKFNSEKHEYVNTLPPWWVPWVFLSFAIKLNVREKSQESKIWKQKKILIKDFWKLEARWWMQIKIQQWEPIYSYNIGN